MNQNEYKREDEKKIRQAGNSIADTSVYGNYDACQCVDDSRYAGGRG